MDKNEGNPHDVVVREFQELFDQMQLPKHREATEAFFRATAEELNAAYRDICAENRTKAENRTNSISNLGMPPLS